MFDKINFKIVRITSVIEQLNYLPARNDVAIRMQSHTKVIDAYRTNILLSESGQKLGIGIERRSS